MSISKWISLAGLLLVCQLCFSQMPSVDKYVLTEKEAILIHPPVLVSGFKMVDRAWSSDGRYLLSLRKSPPPGDDELTRLMNQLTGAPERSTVTVDLFEVKTGKIWKLFEDDSDTVSVRNLAFIGSNQAFFVVDARDPKRQPPNLVASAVYSASPQSPRPRLIQSAQGGVRLDFYASPIKPIGMIVRINAVRGPSTSPPGGNAAAPKQPDYEAAGIDGQGRMSDWFPVTMNARDGYVYWSKDGLRAIISGVTGVSHDPFTGIAAEAAYGDVYQPPPPPKDLQLAFQKRDIALTGNADAVQFSWLTTDSNRPEKVALLVAGGGAAFSPTYDSILYTHEGVGFVRKLTRVPIDRFQQALAEVEKTRLMAEAQICAEGMLNYGADNDGDLPSPASDWQKDLKPYIRNPMLWDGFNFTLTGNLDKMKDRNKVQLGFRQGEHGRAVAYADGHVEWVPNR